MQDLLTMSMELKLKLKLKAYARIAADTGAASPVFVNSPAKAYDALVAAVVAISSMLAVVDTAADVDMAAGDMAESPAEVVVVDGVRLQLMRCSDTHSHSEDVAGASYYAASLAWVYHCQS